MNNRLYVGNLAYSATNETLIQQFSEFGTVSSAKLVMDRETGRSKGFAFVEMETEADAQAVVNVLDGTLLVGGGVQVNVAWRPGLGTGGCGGDRGGYRNNRY